jgi:hypothetical protein
VGVACATDGHFAGILRCWPDEWGGRYASFVLDVATAIRAGKVMVAVVENGEDAKDQPDKEEVVGWLMWDDRFIPGSLYLRKAAVHKDYRNKGVLGVMLTRVVDFASKASFNQIVADLGPDSMITPEYAKRVGGQPIGEVRGLAGENYVTTFWSLKPRASRANAS